MAERDRRRPREPDHVLKIRDLHVYYGHSHALQGVNLTLEQGILAVVGRNGMGKTTLCQAIMGLVKSSGGSIRYEAEELRGLSPSRIGKLGVGYVPQGRRLWPSLSVDEHLRLCARGGKRANWTVERVYQTFPNLAERRSNLGGQLSGGEQQMLAISRALLGNPRLLIMDEPTEGLAPVIVDQVEDMLITLGEEEDISILVIEQNIGVATAVSDNVAIMVNGRINRIMDAVQLAADRDLQQRLLGVGRHGQDDLVEPEPVVEEVEAEPPGRRARRARGGAAAGRRAVTQPKVFISNPALPTRWSQPASLEEILAASAAASTAASTAAAAAGEEAALPEPLRTAPTPLRAVGGHVALVVGTLDTKGKELKFIRDCLSAFGIRSRMVDLSTSGKPSAADVPPHQVAAYHRKGPSAVFTRDRGTSVREMAVAFENWIVRQRDIAGIISAGGSGGTALVTPGMRRLPVGIPKVMISTVASGDVKQYVGGADIMMMYSVTDVQGLNQISRKVLANGANALAGMIIKPEAERGRPGARRAGEVSDLPAIGLTMFGVTTPCVQQVTAALEDQFDCLVFHATGTGGQSMENLVDSGLLVGVIDLTTTEVCDLLVGGVFAATEDRFGSIIRSRLPYVGSCGALDMVNFGALDSVPAQFRGRNLYEHNPQVTLMRTTPEECDRIGRWIGERLNQMDGAVRFFLPEGGVSLLDAPGQPFHDPQADAALFAALEDTVRQTGKRQLIRLPYNINDPTFAEAVASAFLSIAGRGLSRRRSRR
jgi:uncharacterized protein (UPF0261 family)/ABC-type branched-subunit amino acid transport system ATPase component